MGEHVHTLWLMIAVSLSFGWAVGASAADNTAETAEAANTERVIAAAIKDANEGRCREAFSRLSERVGLENRARLLAGQCRIRAGLYPEALNDLNRVRGAEDLTAIQIGDVELYRAVAFYHLERYTEAAAALGRADGRTSEEAQVLLYRGLIALRDGNSAAAAPALESAARLSPAMTEPVASYYAGLAWQGSAERKKARAAFERVIAIDGDGPWGKEATKMLASTAPYPFYVNMSVGIEFDDNVQLRGGVTQTVPAGSTLFRTDGEKDFRGVWRIDAGVQLLEIRDWSFGLTGSYSGNAHDGLDDFDTHYPTVGAYLAHRLDPATTAQARYQFGYAWVDSDSFLQTQVSELSVSHVWPKAGTTVVLVDAIWNGLRVQTFDVRDAGAGDAPGDACSGTNLFGAGVIGCGPAGLREKRERNRDGIGIGGAIEHRLTLPVPALVAELVEHAEISGGYRFQYYDSRGSEWKHTSHHFGLGLAFEFPFEIGLDTRFSYEYRDFLQPSTFPDIEAIDRAYALSGDDREEHEVRFMVELKKGLTEHLSVSARWSYLDNESNRRVYDYTRHIVGGYLNFRFD